ncbi:MAG TPA: nucleotidyltransferase family protein [Thermoleophilaceae bacterium]
MTTPALQAVAAAVATASGVPEPRQPTGEIDWGEFLRLVDLHRIAPLVQRSGWLTQVGAPQGIQDGVRERTRSNTRKLLRVAAVQRNVVEVLAAARVEALVLKGVTAAIDAHGDPGARFVGDLDLLVAPASAARAVAALRAAGLEWQGWNSSDESFGATLATDVVERVSRYPAKYDVKFEADGVCVELHWRLFANPSLMPVDPVWLRRPRHLSAHGARVPALPLSAQWVYTLVHGLKHLWLRMQWLADVPGLALHHPQLVRRDALEAVGRGYVRSVATGLLVAETVLGPFLPRGSREWAAGIGGTGVLVRRSLDTLARGPARFGPRRAAGEVVGRMALRSDIRYRLDEARLLLLHAALAQEVERPGPGELAAGPLRWSGRTARRLATRFDR